MALILDLLFPKKCVGCRKVGSYFCANCIAQIAQADLVCPKCERPAVGGATHPVCRRRFGLDGLWSLGVYSEPLRSAIQKLKYKGVEDLAEILVNVTLEYWAKYQPFLLDEIKKSGGKDWLVVPVPLYWFRENKRGFNQSDLFGQILSKSLGLDYSNLLKRTRYTKSQTKLTEAQRRKNIRNAFTINDDQLTINNVLLVDDVWTTGATLRECCYILKRNGVEKIWALTLAR